MLRRWLLVVPAAVLLGLAPDVCQGADASFGPRAGYNIEADAALVGLEWQVAWDKVHLALMQSYEGLIQRNAGLVAEIDTNLLVRIPAHDIAKPTIGGGLSLLVSRGSGIDDAFDVGGNVLVGLDIVLEKLVPFMNVRIGIANGDVFPSLIFGLRFPLG